VAKLLNNATLSYNQLPFRNVLPLPAGDIAVPGKKTITIGFSNTCYNVPWRVSMLASVQAEVARHSNVKLIAVDGGCDAAKQINSVQDLLAQHVDAVVLSPLVSSGLVPAANAVTKAGIPLIVMDRDVPTAKSLFIGQSNITMAEALANQMIKDLHGHGNIVDVTGLSGSSPAIDRQKGLMAALAGHPGIHVLATGDGQWLAAPAQTLMQDWLARFGTKKIDAVWTDTEPSAWGTLPAIKQAGACGSGIKQYTMDGSSAGLGDVKNGTFAAEGTYTPLIGDVAVRATLMLLQKQSIPNAKAYAQPGKWLQLPDSPVATTQNVGALLPGAWNGGPAPLNPCKH
jgi:ABC-type sugar transport system substrate-binding protein